MACILLLALQKKDFPVCKASCCLAYDMRQPRLLHLAVIGKHMQVVMPILSDQLLQVDTNVGRICARLGWLPLDAEKALEVILIVSY